MDEPILIAEVGCNHMGSMDIARTFIETASDFCKVKYIKFQKRNVRSLLTAAQYDDPHPVPANAYGATYGAHREYLEFSIEQHAELKEYCEAHGMNYSASVWDTISFEEITSLSPSYIKIPSATNTNTNLLGRMADEFNGQIHVSLGMTTRAEEEQLIQLFDKRDRLGSLVLYACTSGYPVEPEDTFLLEITRLISDYSSSVHAIGYSGHHNGISLDLCAYTLGARYIERHFTLNRTWKGTDHAASLEPDGLRRLQRDLRNASVALAPRTAEIATVEIPQRAKLKWINPVA